MYEISVIMKTMMMKMGGDEIRSGERGVPGFGQAPES